MHIHLSAKAQKDLEELITYIADNPAAATHVRDALLETCDRMLASPALFPIQLSVIEDLHKAVVGRFQNYVIYYQVVSDGISIVRLGDGRRDWEGGL